MKRLPPLLALLLLPSLAWGQTYTVTYDTTFQSTSSRGTNGTANTFATGANLSTSDNNWTDAWGNLFAVPSAGKLRNYQIASTGQTYQDGTTSGITKQLMNACYRGNAGEQWQNGEVLGWMPSTALTLNQNDPSLIARYSTDTTGFQANITCNPSAGSYKFNLFFAHGATPTRASPKNNGSNWQNVANAFTTSENSALSAIITAGRDYVVGLSTVTATSNDRTYIVLRVYDSASWSTYDSSGGTRPFPVVERIITSLDADTSPSGTLRRSGSPGVAMYNYWGSSGGANTATTRGLDGFRTYSYSDGVSCATPAASVAAGTYGTAQTIRLQSATLGATIRYTTDGTTPTTTTGTVYDASVPITISSTTTVRAIAYRSGDTISTSSVASLTYTISTPNPFSISTPQANRVFQMSAHGLANIPVSGSVYVAGTGNVQARLSNTMSCTTNTTTTVTVPQSIGIWVGETVTGSGIPANTTVTAIASVGSPTSTTITISNAATASATTNLTFTGSWTTIATNVTGNTSTGTLFSGALNNVQAGQYTVTFSTTADSNTQQWTVPLVGVGIVGQVWGQSNGSGRGASAHYYNQYDSSLTGTGTFVSVYTGPWVATMLANDGTYQQAPSASQTLIPLDGSSGQSAFDSYNNSLFDTAAAGAYATPLAGKIMGATGVPVMLENCAAGGTSIEQWDYVNVGTSLSTYAYPTDPTDPLWAFGGTIRGTNTGGNSGMAVAAIYRALLTGGVGFCLEHQGETNILTYDYTLSSNLTAAKGRKLNVLKTFPIVTGAPIFPVLIQKVGTTKEFTPLSSGSYPANTAAWNGMVASLAGRDGIWLPIDMSITATDTAARVDVSGNSDGVHLQGPQTASALKAAYDNTILPWLQLKPALDFNPASAPVLLQAQVSQDGVNGQIWLSEPCSGSTGFTFTRSNGATVTATLSAPAGSTSAYRTIVFDPPLTSSDTLTVAYSGGNIASTYPTSLATISATSAKSVNRSTVAAPTITGITVTPGSGSVASGTAMTATVNGSNVSSFQTVIWSTTAGSINATTGVLTGANGTVATVTALSAYDGTTTGSATVTITSSGTTISQKYIHRSGGRSGGRKTGRQ